VDKFPYTLEYPVYTQDRVELLPAGTILSPDVLKELRCTQGCRKAKSVKLLEYGTIKKDLIYFYSQPPYHNIFVDSKETEDLMALIENVELSLPVLESLDYFKVYDFYTYRHMLLVFVLSVRIGMELIPNYQELMQQAVASPSHDFGKICVPLNILKKQTPLTHEERRHLGHHALAGYVLLSCYIDDSRHLSALVARDHHERVDGSGYPAGSRLTDRMVEIVVASDIYDALISPRPYRRISYDNRTALEEMCDQADQGLLNWDVVETLISCNRRKPGINGKFLLSYDRRGTPPAENYYGITID
jgi:HD-GYP domain-containing protein (c-di-GMP phosphodiesterase class II)